MTLGKPLRRSFYERDSRIVAEALIGCRLVHRLPDGMRLVARIVEVEAYMQDDEACHASRGKTARNAVMFGPPGTAYVYFVYGMHHCFNAVTEPEGAAAAVLVRALEPLVGLDVMRRHRKGRTGVELTNGPAKLCYALAVDRALNGVDLVASTELWIERDVAIEDGQVATGPRVGVRGDERALTVAWRFWLAGSPYASQC